MVYASLLLVLCGDIIIIDIIGGAQYDNCTDGNTDRIQNGYCDYDNNKEDCDYDGGDCCECTCMNGLNYNCGEGGFFCRDPNSNCVDPRIQMYPNCTDGYIPHMEDGWCDADNNNEECGYDGGDCCECTCSNGLAYDCGVLYDFFCRDPNSGCVDPRLEKYPNCTDGYIPYMEDGWCDVDNNNEACDYDGGDCCECTCIYGECGRQGFSCIDSDVSHLEPYICTQFPPSNDSCPPAPQRDWVVGNNTQARALAEALRCPGGSFHVTWKGDFILNETISVTDRTVLNVTNGDANSSIIGDGKTRLFTVVDASLYLSNVVVSNGNAIYGGAIAASRSTLAFESVTFDGNKAIQGGGALFLSDGANVSLGKEIVFVNNTGYSGGAMYVTGGSNVSCTGNTTFSVNKAENHGGALYLLGGSSVTWNGESSFSDNWARYRGGGLHLSDSSSATWNAKSCFSGNWALYGGGLYLSLSSSATWKEYSLFYTNMAGDNGGALHLSHGSSVTWNAESRFSSNMAEYDGGALYLSDSSATWNAESSFSANSAGVDGGALLLSNGSRSRWNAKSHFSVNRVQSDGGAVHASEAEILWNDRALFVSNAAQNGGAIFVTNGAMAEWTRETNFTSNIAIVNGGAVGSRASFTHEQDSVITMKGATSFVNNTCGGNGGGMALVQSLGVLFESSKTMFSYNSAGVSGGAVFVSGTAFGTVFMNVVFVSNNAQIGGGVRATESGTAITISEKTKRVVNPTTFVGCKFVGNSAFGTGGAIDSASGQDVFNATLFEGNQARVGGALRLAGTASVVNCSFIDNTSNLGEGPAVSNTGYISTVTNVYFHGNVFNCESQMFLEFTVSSL